MNAADFIIEQANILTERGWQVEIKQTHKGKFELISFLAFGRWFDGSISGFAVKGSKGRWRFKGIHVHPIFDKDKKRTTYQAARIAVDVYGHEITSHKNKGQAS
jgi:hypothetical protein